MVMPIVLVSVFIIMLLYPMVMSSLSPRIFKGGAALHISSTEIRDPRYFSKSFIDGFSLLWPNYRSKKATESTLDEMEMIVVTDGVGYFPQQCEKIVLANENRFIPPPGISFRNEILACEGAYLKLIPEVYAIRSEKELVLGKDVKLLRWADSKKTMIAEGNNDLGISCTSKTELILGNNCTFRRLYAPVIFMGNTDMDLNHQENLFNHKISKNLYRNIRNVYQHNTDESGLFAGSIISKYKVKILEGFSVQGHVRSHQTVVLQANSCIYGNLFAEGDVYIGEGARVFGTVFSQGNIAVDKNAVIGYPGVIRSVIARGQLIFYQGAQVYGYVSTEQEGICCPESKKDENSVLCESIKIAETPTWLEKSVIVTNDGLLGNWDSYSFRDNPILEEIILPRNWNELPGSFFYRCTKLNYIKFPDKLLSIGDFCFYNCDNLTEIDLSGCSNLKIIGSSTFEGCKNLRKVIFPSSLRSIGSGAFRNCNSLKTILFPATSQLHSFGSHIFMHCTGLAELELPEYLEEIGGSAFYGCESLKKIRIPKRVSSLGGYSFFGCEALKQIKIESLNLTSEPNLLRGVTEQTKVLVSELDVMRSIYPQGEEK